MEYFGIFSPTLGLRKDVPSVLLPDADIIEAVNVHLIDGELHRVKMRTDVLVSLAGVHQPVLDEEPIFHYHWFVNRTTKAGYLLAFTQDHIYLWNDSLKEWQERYECLEPAKSWETITFNDRVIAVTSSSMVLCWGDDIEENFAPLDTVNGLNIGGGLFCTAAAHITTFENYVLIGNTMEGGDSCRNTVRWCDTGDATTWTGGNSGAVNLTASDEVTGFGKVRGRLYVFHAGCIHTMWGVPTTDIFNAEPVSETMGTNAGKSIVADRFGDLHFFASDGRFRTLRLDDISRPIDSLVRGINAKRTELVAGTRVDEYGEIWWAAPVGTDYNNRIFAYNGSAWHTQDLETVALTAIGSLGAQGPFALGWSDLPDHEELFTATPHEWNNIYSAGPDGTWQTWVTMVRAEGSPLGDSIDIVSDRAGYTYKNHANLQRDTGNGDANVGNAFTGTFTLTTNLTTGGFPFKQNRLLEASVYVRRESGGSIRFSVRPDLQRRFMGVGEMPLTGNEDILIKRFCLDARGRSFELKFESEQFFRFAGVVLGFQPGGVR